jgi:hypothetical protein
MAYPTSQEFAEVLRATRLEDVVDEYLFQGHPYVFRRSPRDFETLRQHLHDALGISAEAVLVVGSGKLGFSLRPDTFGRPFNRRSDVDVVVVSEDLFDRIWRTLLSWNYPRRYKLGPDQKWANARMDDLYWGWFRPHRMRFGGLLFPDALRPLRDISTAWFNAFRALSLYPEFTRWEIKGRLYRTWEHARLYHVDGLRQIRDVLSSSDLQEA